MRVEIVPLLVMALATYRLTRFFVHDSLMGASADSGSRWSVWVDGFAYEESGNDRGWIRGKVGDLLTCHYCLSFWVALLVYGAWTRFDGGPTLADGVTVFAIAGAVSLAYEFLDRETNTIVNVPRR